MSEKKDHKNTLFKLRQDVLVCLFLVVATLAVYWQVQSHNFLNFDDDVYVYDNYHVQDGLTLKNITWAFTSTHAANWHPLTWLSHMLDCQLFGLNPGRHHLTSLLIHIANSLLLFLVFRKMTRRLWQSAFVAALFALHPLHVESVAWISERKDVLSTFFWILTMWSYAWYVEHPAIDRYLLVLLFFILGLLSKPMLVTLPFVLLLLDFWPLDRFQSQLPEDRDFSQQRSPALRLFCEKIPLFILTAISSTVTFYAQKHGEAVASLDAVSLNIRISNALCSYVKYIAKMFFPVKLAALYPYSGALPWWQISGAFLLLLFISYAAVKEIKQRPYFTVGWLWYLGTLVPVIGLVQVGSQSMADRYTYVPFIGLFIIVAWGVPELTARLQHRKKWLAVLSTFILAILTAATWKQVGHWQNSITLFEQALKSTNNNYRAHNNLGLALAAQRRIEEAIDHYLKALLIKSDFVKAHNNLGLALVAQRRTDKAIEHYLQALQIKPDDVQVHINIGVALDNIGRTEEAINHYLQALRIKPDDVGAHNNLGLALDRQGRTDEAIEHYLQALQIRPDYVKAIYNLGIAHYKQGRAEEAIDYFIKALKINPESAEAHYNLGLVLNRRDRSEEAIEHFIKALRIKPDFEKAHNKIGVVLVNSGKLEEAIAHFRKALQIDPDNSEALDNLNQTLATLEKIDREIKGIQKQLTVSPQDPSLHFSLGNMYKMKGQSDKAQAYYAKALSLQPEFPEALYELAKLYISESEYEKALSLYRQMISFLPDSPIGYYNIACIYARQSRPEDAVSWLQKAVARGLDDWNHIKTDKDLDNIRNADQYKVFIKGH